MHTSQSVGHGYVGRLLVLCAFDNTEKPMCVDKRFDSLVC